jgi:hypothetical protein
MSNYDPYAIPFKLGDDIFDSAFKELSHAGHAIRFIRVRAKELAVQRQHVELKGRAAMARRILIDVYSVITLHVYSNSMFYV